MSAAVFQSLVMLNLRYLRLIPHLEKETAQPDPRGRSDEDLIWIWRKFPEGMDGRLTVQVYGIPLDLLNVLGWGIAS